MKKLVYISFLLLLPISQTFSQIGTDTISGDLERAYSQLTNRGMYGGNMWIYGECRSDNSEVGGESLMDQASWHQAEIFNSTADDYHLAYMWRRSYTIIFFCNRVIEGAPTSGLLQEEQNRYIAEAKFLRALIHFNMAILFDSVPVCTSVFNWEIDESTGDYQPGNMISQPVVSMNEVFNQVKQDLQEAIPELPPKGGLSPEEEFRATSGAAKALLAKTYLYESSYAKNYPGDIRFVGMELNWNLAAQYANDVIHSSEYGLLGGGTYNSWWDNSYLYPESTSAFRYLFTVDGNNSPESVFAAHNLTLGSSSSNYGNNEITVFTAVRNYTYVYNEVDQSGMLGWGFNIPTQSLVDAFGESTGTPEDDPRFHVTIGEEGDSIYVTSSAGTDWYAIDFNSYPETVDRSCRKFECAPEELYDIGSHFQSPINIPVIRYADVLLLAAEAELELENTISALELVNMVRTRAGIPVLTSLSFDDIVKERRLELALEGHRFFDLIRWNYAHNVLNGMYVKTQNLTVSYEPGLDDFLPQPTGLIGTPSSIGAFALSEKSRFNFFPNPVDNQLTVVKNDVLAQIEIYDLNGTILGSDNTDKSLVLFNLSELPAGIYFIRSIHKESINTKKFIKK